MMDATGSVSSTVGCHMWSYRICHQCGRRVKGAGCVFQADGVLGPEYLCPFCEGITDIRPSPLGWAAAIAWGVVLTCVVAWLAW